ncbi:hypothetical protein F7725_001713 [Dissostichus mawsoni]|uniref:Uncharacterized protein n=1 Tax=Dissostichus mawsoni TaxID=36200 RepID=A0A7J5Y0D6_DISMA|nr:hypothetical protein F7725_001713 [Dissostichus mawsoni]
MIYPQDPYLSFWHHQQQRKRIRCPLQMLMMQFSQHLPPVGRQYLPRVGRQYLPRVGRQYLPRVGRQYLPRVGRQYLPRVERQHLPPVERQHLPPVGQQHLFIMKINPNLQQHYHNHYKIKSDDPLQWPNVLNDTEKCALVTGGPIQETDIVQHWRGVIQRVIAIICHLAERKLAFRGETNVLDDPHINHVSKILQSPSVSLETLKRETSAVRVYLENFRDNGLAASQMIA